MSKSLEFAKKMDHLEVVEEAISPFDLQKQTNCLSQTLSREYSPQNTGKKI
jgi:hypothetical protein